MKFNFDYKQALYRKNNFGQPCVWIAYKIDTNHYAIEHGIVGKNLTKSIHNVKTNVDKELNSKFKDKRKYAYKYLNELKDNVSLPVEEALMEYLTAYLDDYRTTADGSMLPMLAKAYNNENNKMFSKVSLYLGQYKINGLRCFISAYRTEGMFSSIGLRFQSREGTYWNSLKTLESYLLLVIPDAFLEKMVEEHYILDGELYLPGYSVNDINHFVKDANCPQNKFIQFWCYDLAIQDYNFRERKKILYDTFGINRFNDIKEHLNNTNKLIVLPDYCILDDSKAVEYRDSFIDCGFEGLILRNPNEEYQFGKRNSAMYKYKKSTDGKFKIVEIISEGLKRPDIPLFICQNDINDYKFECHCGGTLDYQREIFKNKEKYEGKYMYIEYGERSGVSGVPFHIKHTHIIM
ncbi:hypothetical protein [Clostridium sp.]|uniref:ATP-dependent DNA ligase n=1 Tax=Clostridium sp. TaxID=1506 RepID=UPI0025B89746|nr:hypothetical protein [Clostridium sp.]